MVAQASAKAMFDSGAKIGGRYHQALGGPGKGAACLRAF
jgi:hypothetical protein